MSGIERLSVIELQMSRQREHKKAVDCSDGDFFCTVGRRIGIFEAAQLLNCGCRCSECLVHINAQP